MEMDSKTENKKQWTYSNGLFSHSFLSRAHQIV